MPVVTGVEAAASRPDVLQVQLDGRPWAALPADLVAERGLREGVELTPAEVGAIEAEAACRFALGAALRALAVRQRSRAELERHLRLAGHGDAAIAAALSRCDELGYLDDRAFAAAFARDRIRLRPRGLARLRAELRGRGVDEEEAERGIAEALEEEGTSEAELLERAARRRWRALRGLDPEVAERRLAAYLLRRGFPPAQVWATVRRLARGSGQGPPA